MKTFILLLAGFILTGLTVNANTSNKTVNTRTFYNSYNNSIIFVENGIEFSVFRDGQFDFNILRANSRLNVSIGNPNINLSFNSGFDYNAYIQYDEFGAVIQIENTPVFYDFYGRVSQIGNITLLYNNFGYISRVGGLYVHYRNNVFSHQTGFINSFNRAYVYRPWHRFYSVPAYNNCVVYNRPYRQFYNPVRYVYERPFYNNYRPTTAIASRRGDAILRNRSYATSNRSYRNITRINNTNYRRGENNNQTTIANNRTNLRQNATRRTQNHIINRDITRHTNTNRDRGSIEKPVTQQKNNLDSRNPNHSNARIYNKNNSSENRNARLNKPRNIIQNNTVSAQNRRQTALESRKINGNNTRLSTTKRRL